MKKLTLIALFIPILTGCVKNCRTSSPEMRNTPEGITEFNYKGHHYIKFQDNPRIDTSSTGIVHNPDCPCHLKERK